jgi:hypothetical protein
MTTLKELNEDFKEFDEAIRKLVEDESESKSNEDLIRETKTLWYDIFGTSDLDEKSAEGMLDHYRGMRKGSKKGLKNVRRTKNTRKLRKQKGGMAPIGATMGPGFPTMQTYGNFPSDITTNTSMARALDIVGGNPGMSSSCGKEESLWPTPSASMGSNKVGGGRQTRKTRRKNMEGGSLLDSTRPLSTNPPGIMQQAYNTFAGVAPVPSGDPIDQTWKMSSGFGSILNPTITKIGSDINQLATPAPWGKS